MHISFVLTLVALGCTTDDLEATYADGSSAWMVPMAHTLEYGGFNQTNPYLAGNTSCFGAPMKALTHAGADWTPAGSSQVFAVGDGEVIYAQDIGYPGSVVVLAHELSAAERQAVGVESPTLYSMLAHLAPWSVTVQEGDWVGAGDLIASLTPQGTNTHLHWEMRTVAEVSGPCGTSVPGRGYTKPQSSAYAYGYLPPASTIAALQTAMP